MTLRGYFRRAWRRFRLTSSQSFGVSYRQTSKGETISRGEENQGNEKVKLSIQMTVNGYVAGPNGENDWMTWNPDDEFMEFINSHFDSSDTILLGRKMADGFIKHWENALDKNPDNPICKKNS